MRKRCPGLQAAAQGLSVERESAAQAREIARRSEVDNQLRGNRACRWRLLCDLGAPGPDKRKGDDQLAAIRGQWPRRARSLSPRVIRAPRQAARLLGHRSRSRPGLTACRPRRLSRPCLQLFKSWADEMLVAAESKWPSRAGKAVGAIGPSRRRSFDRVPLIMAKRVPVGRASDFLAKARLGRRCRCRSKVVCAAPMLKPYP